MLSNAYFLAKFRFDTAENEAAKNLQKFAKFCYADAEPASEAAVAGQAKRLVLAGAVAVREAGLRAVQRRLRTRLNNIE